jgi:hypothetical protein
MLPHSAPIFFAIYILNLLSPNNLPGVAGFRPLWTAWPCLACLVGRGWPNKRVLEAVLLLSSRSSLKGRGFSHGVKYRSNKHCFKQI